MGYAETEKFVYVFSKEARDRLLKNGMTMIASYEKKDIYIFVNEESMNFALDGVDYLRSNKLTF